MESTQVATEDEQRARWLARRRQGLGGSDIAAILGLSPYKGALEVWAEKTGRDVGEVRDAEELENLEMGHEIEPVVASIYKKRMKRRGFDVDVVETPFEVLQHPRHSWWLGSRDRKIIGHPLGFGTLECKNTDKYFMDAWLAGGPDYYLCQTQWYLGAEPENPGGVLAGLIGGNRFIDIQTPRNDKLISEMEFLGEEFWTEYVLKDREPPADGLPSTSRVLRRLHPKDNGQMVFLPPDLEETVTLWENAKARVKAAEAEVEKHANTLKQAIGDATFGKAGLFMLSYKHQTQPPEACEGCNHEVRKGFDKRVLLRVGARKKSGG
jgi:putative phage-type endonuclease